MDDRPRQKIGRRDPIRGGLCLRGLAGATLSGQCVLQIADRILDLELVTFAARDNTVRDRLGQAKGFRVVHEISFLLVETFAQ